MRTHYDQHDERPTTYDPDDVLEPGMVDGRGNCYHSSPACQDCRPLPTTGKVIQGIHCLNCRRPAKVNHLGLCAVCDDLADTQ